MYHHRSQDHVIISLVTHILKNGPTLSLKNKNLIKISKDELIFLKQVALDLTNKKNILKGNAFLSLHEYIYNKTINYD